MCIMHKILKMIEIYEPPVFLIKLKTYTLFLLTFINTLIEKLFLTKLKNIFLKTTAYILNRNAIFREKLIIKLKENANYKLFHNNDWDEFTKALFVILKKELLIFCKKVHLRSLNKVVEEGLFFWLVILNFLGTVCMFYNLYLFVRFYEGKKRKRIRTLKLPE